MDNNISVSKREQWLDMVKAVAVSAVVFHHAGFPVLFLNMIFVSVFFITSGFVFREQTFKSFIVKQIKRLWIPFVLSNFLVLLGHNLLCALGLWEGNPYGLEGIVKLMGRSLFFVEADSLCAPQWFVFMIFCANIAFYGLYYLAKMLVKLIVGTSGKEKSIGSLSIMDVMLLVICIAAYICGMIFANKLNSIMWGNSAFITNVLFGMILYYIGYISNKYKLASKLFDVNKVILVIVYIICTGVLLFTYFKLGYIADHRAGYFSHPYIMPAITLVGLVWIMLLSKGLLEKIPYVRDIISYVGQNSLYVMLFHGLAFQIITFIQVKICLIPYDPAWIWQNIYMGSGLWVVSAGLVGTLVPVGIKFISDFIKKSFSK